MTIERLVERDSLPLRKIASTTAAICDLRDDAADRDRPEKSPADELLFEPDDTNLLIIYDRSFAIDQPTIGRNFFYDDVTAEN